MLNSYQKARQTKRQKEKNLSRDGDRRRRQQQRDERVTGLWRERDVPAQVVEGSLREPVSGSD